ncbi:MAG: hypothetical protein H5T97_08835 [Firmicutes bacterium]|nr:hypothetical protein [Bacillota bacterium]
MTEAHDHDWLRHLMGVRFAVPGALEGLVPAGEIRTGPGGLVSYRLSQASLEAVWERYGRPKPRPEKLPPRQERAAGAV